LELSKLRGEAAKIPSLDQQIKTLMNSNSHMVKEKQDLCELVSSLRDQLNEMEDEKTNAKHDEALMREKLGFVVKEKDILNQKIRNLEGMYQSELGEIQHAEEVLQQLKKSQMELEYMKKNEKVMKREKEELKAILQGLKEQINEIEQQRDHFEDAHDKLQAELERMNDRHMNLVELHHHKDSNSDNILQEMNVLRTRLDNVIREKQSLEQENIDLQDRLDDNINKIYEMESKRNSVGAFL
jgi:chromosome segregation ATPase